MMLYDTALDVPKYAIAIADIVDDDDLGADRTEHLMAQHHGGLVNPATHIDDGWNIVNTTQECATCFVAVPSIIPDALSHFEAALAEMSRTEMYATKTFGEVMIAETADLPSEWMLASHSRASPTYRLIARLKKLFETPEGERWPSTTWPVQDAFEDAKAFISKLPLTHIPDPVIRFADDGEINFLWVSEDVHIDLGFYGTGTYSYFGQNNEGQEIQEENVVASGGLAKEIKNILTA